MLVDFRPDPAAGFLLLPEVDSDFCRRINTTASTHSSEVTLEEPNRSMLFAIDPPTSQDTSDSIEADAAQTVDFCANISTPFPDIQHDCQSEEGKVYSIQTNGDVDLQNDDDPSFPGDFPPAPVVEVDIASFIRA
jgi:hypothetical protein